MIRALLATLNHDRLFFAGVVPAKAAIIIGGLLLLTRRVKSRRVYAEIDWSLLLMFAGLFIIVAGAQHALLTPYIIAAVGRLHLDQVPVLSAVTAVLSNLVSNVPAVLMLKPFVEALKDHDTAWLVIAMASTLAGNFTVLGSIANLIVVQRAGVSGVTIGFWDYFRVGAIDPHYPHDRDAMVMAVKPDKTAAAGSSPISLDAINFLSADVRGAIGPYLNVFLVTRAALEPVRSRIGDHHRWPARVRGADADRRRDRRDPCQARRDRPGAGVLGIAAVIIFAWPTFWPVAIANSLMAVVGDVFGPAVAALTLGLYARKLLARRMGRNSAFDHAGNVAIAVVAGAVGYASRSAPSSFSCRCSPCLPASRCCPFRPRPSISTGRETSTREPDAAESARAVAGYGILFKSRPLVIFGLCVMLFHFANAPLLPLVGQKLAAAYPKEATAMMSACIVAAQAVMLPIALLVGHTADSLGAEAAVPRRVRHPADPCGALHLVRQQLLADRRPGARWRRRRDFRRARASGDRRYHARHRALQFGPGRDRHGPGDRRLAERACRRRDRRSFRL